MEESPIPGLLRIYQVLPQVFRPSVPVDSLLGRRIHERYYRRLDKKSGEKPMVFQIFGNDAQILLAGAQRIEELEPDIIDINMGCPAKKVCKKLSGSALLKDEDLVRRILDAVVAATELPVTLKTRTGWSPAKISKLNFLNTADSIEQVFSVFLQG